MSLIRPNEIGMHRGAFSVDDIDAALEIAARHRGPSGIIVMLAEELKNG